MNVIADSAVDAPLSARLKQQTHAIHDSLDSRISGLAPFLDRQHYVRFLRVQLRFQTATALLYEDATLQARFQGLLERSRLDLIEQDCRDLGVSEADIAADRAAGEAAVIGEGVAAVGWLYTNEGSNLGAAFLFKRAQQELQLSAEFGARHLAGHPDGRGLHWKRFKAQLDELDLNAAEIDQAVAGAVAAFALVRAAVEQLMGDVAET
ncbi:biliverdin-producing heme oxygenase [Alloalcanivorax mobilis]|uniref:biliverdin-producing heme oxygenase n=1 Tax=Alloalcanivorax mobilis TaxID=2019569 RepID=UPI000C78DF28|nr:biliverdin-producing heme oxygenase [Alloalcanivorax mobilis]